MEFNPCIKEVKYSCSIVVEHSPLHPKVKGSRPATSAGTGKEKERERERERKREREKERERERERERETKAYKCLEQAFTLIKVRLMISP
jgi:hypothetical protein